MNTQNQQMAKPMSKAGKRIKLFAIFFTFGAMVILTALVFIIRVNDKPLIFAAIDYCTGEGIGVRKINKVDESVLEMFAKKVAEIEMVDKRIEELKAELAVVTDTKRVEEFISSVRLEKNNLLRLRSKVESIKKECGDLELDNMNTADVDAVIESTKVKEANFGKLEDAAYAKMDELRKKEKEGVEVMISAKKPAPPKPETITISMKWNAATKLTLVQVDQKSTNGKEELESLLRSTSENYRKSGKEVVAEIIADSAVPEQEITDMTGICKNNQIEKISFRKEKNNE
jgi:hypothetical protein